MYSFVSVDHVHDALAGSRVGEGVLAEESDASPASKLVSRPGGEGERERAEVTSARREDLRGLVLAASARRRSRLAASKALAESAGGIPDCLGSSACDSRGVDGGGGEVTGSGEMEAVWLRSTSASISISSSSSSSGTNLNSPGRGLFKVGRQSGF